MLLRDVVDQLEDDDRLAHAGAAEQADLAALRVGGDQVDDLDPGLEDLDRGRLVDERFGGGGGSGRSSRLDRAALVDRLADHVHDAAERRGPTGHHGSAGRCSPTSWPRTRPSVVSIAMQRTVFSPRCSATSITRLSSRSSIAGFVTSARCRSRGVGRGGTRRPPRGPSPDDLSLGSIVLWSLFFRLSHCLQRGVGRAPFGRGFDRALTRGLRAGDDLDQLLGDRGLARAVVLQRECFDQLFGVAGRATPSPPCAPRARPPGSRAARWKISTSTASERASAAAASSGLGSIS